MKEPIPTRQKNRNGLHMRSLTIMNHIQIEEILAQLKSLKKERDAYKSELENIATASMKKWEMNSDDFLSEFQAWAQNRARHAISKANA